MTLDSAVASNAILSAIRDRVAAGEPLKVGVSGLMLEFSGDEARALLDALSDGNSSAVRGGPAVAELTTGQAADLLGVSRPTVVNLIDSGQLPAVRVGTRRRVRAQDVLDFRERRRTARSSALDALASMSQEDGSYT